MSREPEVRQAQILQMEDKTGVTGLVLHRGHLVVTHDYDNNLYVYTEGRPPARKHQVPGLVDQCHMVGVTDAGYLVISDSEGFLHWVTVLVEGTEVKLGTVKTMKLNYTPAGMCVTNTGEVVVCSPYADRLYKYSSAGQCLGHMRLELGVRPWYITSLSADDGYVISDYYQIMWIREDGTAAHRVQPGEVRHGIKLGESYDLTHDSAGNILVADYARHQVLVFDPHGHCTGQLLSEQDGIWEPSCLLLDQLTDTLYVSCNDPMRVMIYRYSPLFTLTCSTLC